MLAACAPHPYAVVFGLLRAPKDIVVASRGSSRTVLRHVAIPAILRAHGVLVYARLTRAPREVIVQRPDRTRPLDDKLRTGRCSTGMLIVGTSSVDVRPS